MNNLSCHFIYGIMSEQMYHLQTQTIDNDNDHAHNQHDNDCHSSNTTPTKSNSTDTSATKSTTAKTTATNNITPTTINPTQNCNLPFLNETSSSVSEDANESSYDPFNPRMVGPRYCEYCNAKSTLHCDVHTCDRPTLFFQRLPPPFRNGWQDENHVNGDEYSDQNVEVLPMGMGMNVGTMDRMMIGEMDKYGRRGYWTQPTQRGRDHWKSSRSFTQKQQQLVFENRRRSLDHKLNSSMLLPNSEEGQNEPFSGQGAGSDSQLLVQTPPDGNELGRDEAIVAKDGSKDASSPGKLKLFNMFCSPA